MRDLLPNPSPAARLAVDYFVYQVAKHIGALPPAWAAWTRLSSPRDRASVRPRFAGRICEASAWLGVTLDPSANTRHGPKISTADSRLSPGSVPTERKN
jgi:acetate kinase